MPKIIDAPGILSIEKWTALEAAHSSRIQPWVDAFHERRKRGEMHPVHDFLFDYYQCKRRLITEWHPPTGVVLEGEQARKLLKEAVYSEDHRGVFIDPSKLTENVVSRMKWIIQLLENAQTRRSQLHCYGLHEWAMVYKGTCIRHEATPLRLSPEEIEHVIETQTIRCTHHDAFRFFTEAAQPLNQIQPRRDNRSEHEQFGCVHFNMDLFKWCYKLNPWISSELTLDCFFLAVEARELDMRASPYDLKEFGYEPIKIETPEGREAYQLLQKQIGELGRQFAAKFLKECCKLTLPMDYLSQ
ncbi:MAG: 3-methyladenine DNA glycosylase [Verrucomicrobia bacterium]|nr:3-methyladenine DNA glycosylase [Verrucomicrobiota bacterium]MDA1067782.1 3-methyladenine DNA glycosylase [Verrucomicrobiota bacterium]